MSKRLKQLFGGILLVFGLVGFADEIDDAAKGESDKRTVGLVMSTLCLGGGAWLLVSAKKTVAKPQLAPGLAPEDLVFALAKTRQGKLTPTEVAAETPLKFDEAKLELERLALNGACRAEVSSEGLMVYCFPEFEDTAAKES